MFKFKPFSKKQRKILTWWMEESPVHDMDGIIADGAIRSGKTVSMSLSYVMWAMECFDRENFIIAGKTVGSCRRNVVTPLKNMLPGRGYTVVDKRSDNMLIISKGGKENYFYIFGGKDESSQDLVQGITAAGAYFDEVALMPESFVVQATGRCSVEGSKWWFNCNPQGPLHWFKREWIDEALAKGLVYLHFTMDDNLSLSEKIKARYRRSYIGVFFKRYILGLWVMAEGLIYDMFGEDNIVDDIPPIDPRTYYVSCDYGTQNATVYLLWGKGNDGVWYCIREYYYSGRDENEQKTDTEYADDLGSWLSGIVPVRVVVDPAAASFIAELRKRRYTVKKAKNDVMDGIRTVAAYLDDGTIKIHRSCENLLREMTTYSWDEKAAARGDDKPVKVDDHCEDALRYMCYTIIRRPSGIEVLK